MVLKYEKVSTITVLEYKLYKIRIIICLFIKKEYYLYNVHSKFFYFSFQYQPLFFLF